MVELVRQLDQHAPDLPVLLIAGHTEVEQELPAHVPVLPKPFSPADLAQRLQALLPAQSDRDR